MDGDPRSIFSIFPDWVKLLDDPCAKCLTGACLGADWVPREVMLEWLRAWRSERKKVPAIEKNPPLSSRVKFLRVIKPEEMQEFFQKNCNGKTAR